MANTVLAGNTSTLVDILEKLRQAAMANNFGIREAGGSAQAWGPNYAALVAFVTQNNLPQS